MHSSTTSILPRVGILLLPLISVGITSVEAFAQAPQGPPPSHAAAQSCLGLADFEAIALARNPSLVVVRARVDAAQGKWLQSGLWPNPTVGYHATEIGNLGTAGQQGGFVNQRFITGGKLKLDRAIAAKEIEEARFLFDAGRYRVLNDVRIRFYDALVASRRLELTSELARIGDESVKASDKLLKARLASPNDLLQAEIEAESAYIFLANAQNQHLESWRRLTAVIGAPTMEPTPVVGELEEGLPEYTWEHCLGMVLSQSPELGAAIQRVQRSEFALQRANREWIPDVDVGVSVRHHNVTKSDVANVQVGIPIPIFNANQGNIRRARAQWVAARNTVRQIELDLQDRLAVAYRRYANARQQVERYSTRILPRASKSLELVRTGYRERQVRYLTLLVTQQTYLRVNLAYLDALRELWESATMIDGQLLTGSLSSRR